MNMALKIGDIVSHSGATGWGSGKVLELSATSAMIEFSDGINRKIAASYFFTLKPAMPDSFVPQAKAPVAVTKSVRARTPRAKKK